MTKIFVKEGYEDYASFLTMEYELVDTIKDADIVILTGGHDVSPSMYDEKQHETVCVNKTEDDIDAFIYEKAVKLNKFVIGICKGSQLSCVMNGGKLVQHVTNHAIYSGHKINIKGEKNPMTVTSTHHQMMYPFNLPFEEFELIAVSSERRSDCYWKNDKEEYDKLPHEPEIIWWSKTRTISCQPHPEMMRKDSDFVVWLNKFILEKYEA